MRTERFFHIYIVGLFLFLLLNSCEEKPDFIGIDLIPSGDAIRVSFDSLGSIRGYTVFGDSVLGMKKTDYILGSQVDPYFGMSKAEIVSQIEPHSTIGSFGSNPVVDSVILYLLPKDIIGVTAAPMQLMVYEYTELIHKDFLYWSNMDITGKFRDQVIGTASLTESDTLIRIIINDTVFINKFLRAPDSVLGSPTYLQEYMNGLYITMEDAVSEGVFLKMAWQTEMHRLVFYYGNDSISSNDSISALSLDFPIGLHSTGINLFQHDFTGYPIESFITNGSTDDSLMFIQSMAGVSPILRLEGITDWMDSMPVAIIDAKLTIPVADSSLTQQRELYLPSSLAIYHIENTYKLNYDYLLDWESAGGEYDKYTNSYIFNLKVQMQSIIQGDVENLDLILRTSFENENVNRTVLHGWSQDPAKRMRLEITYTTF